MADTIEKIYCTDGRDNDLAAILAATKNNDSRRELSQRDQTQAIVAGITAAVSQIIAANKATTTTP